MHAGAIFVGPHSGRPSATTSPAPTTSCRRAGNARFSSGLSPSAFLRTQEVVELSAEASAALAAPLAALARAEGFVDHARSGEVRGSVPADTAPAARAD